MSLTKIDYLRGVAEPTKVGEALEAMTQRIVMAGNNTRIAGTIVAQARRELSLLGIQPDAKGRVDIFELNRAFRESGSHLSPERRIAIKHMLAQCGCID